MEFGLMTEPQVGGSYARLAALARWAEDTGLDAFARSDHYLDDGRSDHVTDALTSFGGLALETNRIQLVVLVTPLTFRHPAVIAKTAATIDEMSGGRMALGIGTGWMESEHAAFGLELPALRERFSLFFETLAYVRSSFWSDEGFRGRHFELQPMPVLPKPTGPLPIIVGGSGMKKTPTFAGRFADEYNMFVCDRETFERRRDVMREAAVQAGRDPDAIKISFAGPTMVGETDAEYRSIITERAAKQGRSDADYEARFAGRPIPRGTPEQALEAVATMEELGIDRYYIQEYRHLDAIDTDHLEMVLRAISR